MHLSLLLFWFKGGLWDFIVLAPNNCISCNCAHIFQPGSKVVAGDVYDDVFLCCPFFPRDVLDEILDLIESVSDGYPVYSSFSVYYPKEMLRHWRYFDTTKI